MTVPLRVNFVFAGTMRSCVILCARLGVHRCNRDVAHALAVEEGRQVFSDARFQLDRPAAVRSLVFREVGQRLLILTSGMATLTKPNDRLILAVTWKEVVRKLKAAGFVPKRTGKGSHVLFVHPESGKEIWVTMHGHDAGRLGSRILRDAGVE